MTTARRVVRQRTPFVLVVPADGPCSVAPSDDVFYNYELVRLAEGLVGQAGCDTVAGTSYEKDPQWKAELSRGYGFAGWKAGASLSFTDVVISVRPA